MKQWYKTKFGKAPYKDVILIEFNFDSKTKEETSYLQYKFLLNDDVIQAHLEHATKKGIAIFVIENNPEKILKNFFGKYNIISKETIPYEKVLESNNQFIHKK